MKYKSREEQRKQSMTRKMLSLGLEAHLRNLATAVVGGDFGAVAEFQQYIHYAPSDMKERVATFIDGIKGKSLVGAGIVHHEQYNHSEEIARSHDLRESPPG